MKSKLNFTSAQSQIDNIKETLLSYIRDHDEYLYLTTLIDSRYDKYAIFINYKQG